MFKGRCDLRCLSFIVYLESCLLQTKDIFVRTTQTDNTHTKQKFAELLQSYCRGTATPLQYVCHKYSYDSSLSIIFFTNPSIGDVTNTISLSK